MDPAWLILLLPIAAASGWIAANSSKFQWRRRSKIPSVYLQGINYLLNEQHDKAIELFLDMLEVDSETIEIHLTLGNLYRRRGEIERATLIHENLIDRSDLTGEQKIQAIFELGYDFYTAGILDRAEKIFTELSKDGRYQEQASEILRDIYEQEKEWNNCIKITNNLNQISSKDYSPLLAQYYCEKAEEAIREGRYDQAQEYLKESTSIDANCVRAILQLGRVKAIRGDHQAAILIWRTIEQKNPEFVPETVGLVTESYKAIHKTGELTDYLRATAEAASDSELAIAYVDALEAQKKDESAEKYLINWIRNHPSVHCLHRLILLKLKTPAGFVPTSDFKLIEKLIHQEIDTARRYKCQRCGYSVKTLHWQCPGCRGWNTIVADRHSELPAKSISLETEV